MKHVWIVTEDVADDVPRGVMGVFSCRRLADRLAAKIAKDIGGRWRFNWHSPSGSQRICSDAAMSTITVTRHSVETP